MYQSTYSGLRYYFGLAVLCGLISGTDEAKSRGDGYSHDEKLLYNFYQHKTELNWTWSATPFCRVLSPTRKTTDGRQTKIATKEILLEAPGCVKTEVETLTCVFGPPRPLTLFNLFDVRERYYANNPKGEIYNLRRARGICDDRNTLVINRRLIGGSDAVSARPSKLRGVAGIFKARNAIRGRWRHWNRQRLSGIRLRRDDAASDDDESSGDSDDSLMDSAREIMENVSSILESTLRLVTRAVRTAQ